MADLSNAAIEAAARAVYERLTENRVAEWDDLGRASRRPYRLAAIAALRAASEVPGG